MDILGLPEKEDEHGRSPVVRHPAEISEVFILGSLVSLE